LSANRRRTEAVYAVIKELFADDKSSVLPGDVADIMRERDAPIGTWLIRAEFTTLEQQGLIRCDADTSDWYLTQNSTRTDVG
jgi:hypothetical protein